MCENRIGEPCDGSLASSRTIWEDSYDEMGEYWVEATSSSRLTSFWPVVRPFCDVAYDDSLTSFPF